MFKITLYFFLVLSISSSFALEVVNDHNIEGYTDKISVKPGESIEFKVHSPLPTFNIEISRYDKFDSVEFKFLAEGITGVKQNYPDDAYKNGAGWSTSYTFTIPLDWKSGLYAARLHDASGVEFFSTFIVRELQEGKKANIAVLASTNTWEAYNSWPTYSLPKSPYGKSLYTTLIGNENCDNSNCNPLVSMDRPNPQANPNALLSHLAGGERFILGWLDKNKYAYNLITDWDLNNEPNILKDYDVLIVSTHNEYWTNKMYDGLVHYLDAGGSLLYLSGNGLYWKTSIAGRQIEARKNGDSHLHTGTCGGLWQDEQGPNRPESSILGVQFDSSGAGCGAGQPNTEPYNILEASHWSFDGIDFTNPGQIGVDGFPSICGVGASGWEMDHIDPTHSPSNIVHLAKGVNTSLSNGGLAVGADMVYYDHPGGGLVFSAGSIDFGRSLAKDKNVQELIHNILRRVSGYVIDHGVLDSDGFYIAWKPHVADFNGDGAADILWDWADEHGRSRSVRHLWLNNGQGKFTLASTNVAGQNNFYEFWKPHVADFNGDGAADILWDWADEYGRSKNVRHLWLNDGSGNLFRSDTNVASQNGLYFQWIPTLADFNGDGATDILWDWSDEHGRSRNVRHLWLNDGSGNLTVTDQNLAQFNGFYYLWKSHVADFNGDGAADILWDWSDEYGRSRNIRHLWLNDGSGGFSRSSTNVAGMNNFYFLWKPHFGDFNGDGSADILWDWADEYGRSRNIRHLWLNNGSGEFYVAQNNVADENGLYAGWLPSIVDHNGDQKDDIVWNEVDQHGTSLGGYRIWKNFTGGDFSTIFQQGKTNWKPLYADFNSDGKGDALWDKADEFGRSTGFRDLWLNSNTHSLPLSYQVIPIADCIASPD